MKVKVHYCMIDNGDGSTSRQDFKTAEEAQACLDAELESGYPVPCEAVGWTIFDTNGYEEVTP